MSDKTVRVVLEAVTSQFSAHEGGMVEESERFTADDPLVEAFPKFFSPEDDVKQILAKKEALWAPAIETAGNHPRPLVQRWRAKRRVRVEADAESRVVESRMQRCQRTLGYSRRRFPI